MLKNLVSAFILVFTFSYGAYGQSIYAVHASACEAVNPAALHKVKLSELGLKNVSPPANIWVICPMAMEAQDSFDPLSVVGIVLGNESASGKTISCILKSFTFNGEYVQRSQNIFVSGNSVADYIWEVPGESLLAPTVTCRLLPNTLLVSLLYGSEP